MKRALHTLLLLGDGMQICSPSPRSPWMAQVPVLQEQQTGRLLFSDRLLAP